jgi:hypothetical protein
MDEVVAGKLTRTQYEAEIDKSIEEANKTVEAALKEYDTSLKELRGKFPEGNWYEWDNPFRRIKNVSSEMRR